MLKFRNYIRNNIPKCYDKFKTIIDIIIDILLLCRVCAADSARGHWHTPLHVPCVSSRRQCCQIGARRIAGNTPPVVAGRLVGQTDSEAVWTALWRSVHSWLLNCINYSPVVIIIITISYYCLILYYKYNYYYTHTKYVKKMCILLQIRNWLLIIFFYKIRSTHLITSPTINLSKNCVFYIDFVNFITPIVQVVFPT